MSSDSRSALSAQQEADSHQPSAQGAASGASTHSVRGIQHVVFITPAPTNDERDALVAALMITLSASRSRLTAESLMADGSELKASGSRERWRRAGRREAIRQAVLSRNGEARHRSH